MKKKRFSVEQIVAVLKEADLRRLSAALSEEARGPETGERVFFDLTPKAYQAEMLNRLARERELLRSKLDRNNG